MIHDAIKKGAVELEPVFPTYFDRVLELRREYQGKPNISFADLTTMAAMSQRGITQVVEDEHSLHVGPAA